MPLSRDIDTAGLGAILKTALEAVVVMRFDGTVAGWNDVAERIFGWSFEEAVGRRMSDLIIPERFREAHEAGLARFLTSGEAVVLDQHLELDALHRDGHEFPVELAITRTSSAGEPVFLGFLRDISERRAAERRQQLMIGELNHRVKNLLGVVSAIAHQTIRSSSSLEDSSRLLAAVSRHSAMRMRYSAPRPGSAPRCGRWRRRCSTHSAARAMAACRSKGPICCSRPASSSASAWFCTSSPPTPSNMAR